MKRWSLNRSDEKFLSLFHKNCCLTFFSLSHFDILKFKYGGEGALNEKTGKQMRAHVKQKWLSPVFWLSMYSWWFVNLLSIEVRSMNEKEWDTFQCDRELVLWRMQEFDPYSLPRLSFERHSAKEGKMYHFIPVNLESKEITIGWIALTWNPKQANRRRVISFSCWCVGIIYSSLSCGK